MSLRHCAVFLCLLAFGGCASQGGGVHADTDEPVVSLRGEVLTIAPRSAEATAKMESQLAEARRRHQIAPRDAGRIIWLGRRTAYLGRYREAISIYSHGIELHPEDARLYRHRGHRYVTVRDFDRAIADFTRAAALVAGTPDRVEPDGQPNARGIPTSTLQTNIWYHLGLAHYLKGEFEKAHSCYLRCRDLSGNADMLCATSHWLWMTCRRLGRIEEAAAVLARIHPDMGVIENEGYHSLLLFYGGQRSEAWLVHPARGGGDTRFATVGYGIATHRLLDGDHRGAREMWEAIVARPQWAAFGAIAAEAELAR